MLYDIVYICICYKTYSIQQFVKTPSVNAADEMTNCPPMANYLDQGTKRILQGNSCSKGSENY